MLLAKEDSLKETKYYKYRDAKCGLKLLRECKIKVSTPKTLNDIYELFPFPEIELKEITDEILFGKWKNGFMIHLNESGYAIGNEDDLYSFYNENREVFTEKAKGLKKIVLDSISETVQGMSNYTAVFSMTTNPTQNLMWAYYADGYRGLCIGFDFKEFDYNTTLYKVNYSNNRPKISIKTLKDKKELDSKIIELMTTKAKHWEHEEEYRFLFNIDEAETKKDIILLDIKPKNVCEAYLGPKIRKEDLKELKSILDEARYNHIKVFGIDFDTNNTYDFIPKEIDREKILEYNKQFEQTRLMPRFLR